MKYNKPLDNRKTELEDNKLIEINDQKVSDSNETRQMLEQINLILINSGVGKTTACNLGDSNLITVSKFDQKRSPYYYVMSTFQFQSSK